MWPKEHGAYGQLAFPLVTSLAIAGVTGQASLLVVSIVALFVAHEPLLVLLGRRGPRARREQRSRALRWLVCAVAIAAVTGGIALQMVPPDVRRAMALPLVPGALLGVAIATGGERTTPGEMAAATTFALAAVPVGMAAGASWSTTMAVAVAFAVTFAAQTLGVRGVILAVRGGGNLRAARSARCAALAVAAVSVAALAGAAVVSILPWATVFAATPGLAAAAWIVVAPPLPAQLRRVGWTLVASSIATVAILLVSL
jgi:hypothetical protein